MRDFCSHLMVYLVYPDDDPLLCLLLSVHVCMYVEEYKVFHNADKYELQYTDMASSGEMGVRPTDISTVLESDEVFPACRY